MPPALSFIRPSVVHLPACLVADAVGWLKHCITLRYITGWWRREEDTVQVRYRVGEKKKEEQENRYKN